MKHNRYILTQARILATLSRRGKVSPLKLLNAAQSFAAYYTRRERTAPAPFLVAFELGNVCNANCVFCRSDRGEVNDFNPAGPGAPIPQGRMPFSLYAEILGQLQDRLLMATLYINGEPLMCPELEQAVQLATDRRVASMIATNGILLSPQRSRALLAAGVDFIKIALSGATQATYQVQVRQGDVERVKENICTLAAINRAGRYGASVLVDYILYNYNRHELPVVRRFCDRLGLPLNVRPGNPWGMEDTEPPQSTGPDCSGVPCDLLWKALSVNWNGDLLPCCDFSVWSGQQPYARFVPGQTSVKEIWNGPVARALRRTHLTKGRKPIPICAQCRRRGVAFKF